MKILAIETSCDDTSVSVIEAKNNFRILSNVVSSQIKIHRKYGGVYPLLAKREHQKNLPTVFKKALKQAETKKIDLLAVTVGPGLEPCLWQGINFTIDLAKELKLPIVPVNHVEAHIAANFIDGNPKKIFPAICLVVSGGHTQLILMKNIGKYKILGETRDDAAGECFDKVARILGLGYPGGPIIAKLAQQYNFKIKNRKLKISLPRPMIQQKNYDFSFSGLKTAVLYEFKNRSPRIRKSKEYTLAICHEVQQAAIDVLIRKTIKAAKDFKAKSVILGGGVAANKELRKQLKEKIEKEILNSKLYLPNPKFCTDNAAMVAVCAYFNRSKKKNWQKIKADANLRIAEPQ
ncbi:MAG: tRNA (adenosine(37)-N6)-threonylcarbamoyltransferase complex transferase subunit TsaD [Candidatus Pacebacteria bacterium]|nr:tRNA (adenosine(37)-N6)-threonylcarbamoyltransferase complex transferase subunit TsaD [Candidatus Paceibacterota bacterium]